MNKDNYRLLQVDENASDEEGNNAARMLERLDAAYNEIMEERREKASNTSGASSFEAVSEAIRNGDIARAQQLLDDFNERNAEWHYLQSVVFYKKNWMQESKKQLEIAIQMDGGNAKYREAYEKLKSRADYRQQTGGAPNTNPDPATGGDEQMGGNWCSQCFSFCYTFLCVNCLFNLCCNCR